MKSPESPRVRGFLEALGCLLPDVNFRNTCFFCKAPGETRLPLPHVCSVGLLCNLETCNVTSCDCQNKQIWDLRKLAFL